MEKSQPKNWYERKFTPKDADIQEILDVLMTSEEGFWGYLPQISRGKTFRCREVELPAGDYEELNVTDRREDSRRIIVDKNNLAVFVTLCHYQPDSFYYAGRVGESPLV